MYLKLVIITIIGIIVFISSANQVVLYVLIIMIEYIMIAAIFYAFYGMTREEENNHENNSKNKFDNNMLYGLWHIYFASGAGKGRHSTTNKVWHPYGRSYRRLVQTFYELLERYLFQR
jgi:hypothetical protein